MNIPKKLIGKEVRIFWIDPKSLRITSHFPQTHEDIPKGKAGLARWEERGMIEKVEEGVVYLQQSIATDNDPEPDHELLYSVVPEVLIERIIVMADSETYPPPEVQQ